MSKKIIAFDIGDKWIGFATTDSLQISTYPKEAIENKNFFIFLEKYLLENEIESIVLGLPLTLKNNYSEQTNKILKFKEEIEKIYKNIPIFLIDERYSSKFASNIMKSNKINTNKNSKNSEHSIAACLILENFLIKKIKYS